jgi:hypothetical protein
MPTSVLKKRGWEVAFVEETAIPSFVHENKKGADYSARTSIYITPFRGVVSYQ